MEIALRWQELGAPRLHVVDLDGARDGSPANREAMAAICAAVGVPVEVSGGIRTEADLERALGFGATRVQLGSIAISDPAFVAEAVRRHPSAIVVSIDAKAGEIYTHGWLRATGIAALDFAKQMVGIGVQRLMFTDIGRDGAMDGPNFEALEEMVRAATVPVVAAGGVSRVEHLPRLAAIGCEGAIIGKALYEGAIDLREALATVA